MPHFLSIGSVFKNERPFLKEWIEYHLLIGVQHFYLLDNNSDDDPLKILNPYIHKGLVTYRVYPEKVQPQKLGFNKLVKELAGRTRWLALIDPDEFIVHNGHLNHFLEQYDKYGALAIHWRCFGSSGFKNNPRTTLFHLNKRACLTNHINKLMKLVCRPERVQTVCGSHFFTFNEPYFAVNENFERMPGDPRIKKSWRVKFAPQAKIRINHYPIRSLKNLIDKKSRGYVDKELRFQKCVSWPKYQLTFDQNLVTDTEMSKFQEALQHIYID